jgi:hypothetical protein
MIHLISFFIGLSVLLYPAVSSFWNSKTQSEAIVDYEAMLAAYKPEDYTAVFEAADAYNAALSALEMPLREYQALDLLNLTLSPVTDTVTLRKNGRIRSPGRAPTTLPRAS